jgi:hypothetical protein
MEREIGRLRRRQDAALDHLAKIDREHGTNFNLQQVVKAIVELAEQRGEEE